VKLIGTLELVLALTVAWPLSSFAEFSNLPPELEEDEAGLWMLVERHEQELRTSNRIIEDQNLHYYLHELTCRTVGDLCDGIRVYAIRAPGLNAFMMPNGAMFVQSGLLLRIEDDAELAAVLAHEVSHFQRRHSIESLRRWRKTSSTFAVLSTLVAAAGTVAAASSDAYEDAARAGTMTETGLLMLQAAGIIATFQLVAYDREQEKQADLDGIELMRKRNIDVTGAPRLWHKVIREQAAGGNQSGFSLLATHPTPGERLAYLNKIGFSTNAPKSMNVPSSAIASTGAREIVDQYREQWLLDELAVQHPSQFAAIAVAQAQMGVDPALSLYLSAKSWIAHANKTRRSKRQRTQALQEALSAFEAGDRLEGGMQAEAYRDWGKVDAELDNPKSAKEKFERYLRRAPNAWDAEFIRRQIGNLE